MFGRIVHIEDREIFVLCTPDTPLSEVLERAARQERREEEARALLWQKPYRDAMRAIASGEQTT
jgi:hypothetical protein